VDGDVGLLARLLPPAFDSPPDGSTAAWNGGAQPAVRITALPLAAPIVSAAGNGGAWLGWIVDGEVQVTRLDQGAAASARPLLRWPVSFSPGQSNLQAAGAGVNAWVLETSADRGMMMVTVLRKISDAPAIASRTPVTGGMLDAASLAAGPERCLVAFVKSTPDGNRLQTFTVDAAGQVSGRQELELPPGAVWMGITAVGNGFFGFWSVPFPTPLPWLIYGRHLTSTGAWQADSPAELISPVNSSYGFPSVLPGQSQAIVNSNGSGSYIWRPGSPLQQIHPTGVQVAQDGPRCLRLENSNNAVLSAVRQYSNAQKAPHGTPLTIGGGYQTSPSLAWTTNGLHMVCQLRNYGTAESQLPISGGNLSLGSGPRNLISHPSFFSPAQAWQGDALQLVAYRHDHYDTNGVWNQDDIDDVMGVLYRTAPDGTLTQPLPPFVIGGGLGSQRGVSVAAFGSGFIAAWREESPYQEGVTYLSSIRAAYISPEGAVQPPGGRIMDISVGELSAVSVGDGGYLAWRVPQNPNSDEPSFIRAAMFPGSGFPPNYYNVSPSSHNAVAPKIVHDGWQQVIAWRDKFSRRIYVSHSSTGYSTALPVSPVEARSREPALARLDYGRSAVFWIEESSFPPGIWMAIIDGSGVSAPVLVTRGLLDRDTLTACGDGQGRVALSYLSYGPGMEGLQTLMLAPDVPRNGGLAITPVAFAAPDVRRFNLLWEPSVLFPRLSSIVERSSDLIHWEPDVDRTTGLDGTGRVSLLYSAPAAQPQQYYRLRPVLAPVR
jgi:hypothetical protein